jgi:hypothetical protein
MAANLTLITSDTPEVYRATLHGNLFVPNVISLGTTLVSEHISPSGCKLYMKLIPGFLECTMKHSKGTHVELVPLTSVFSMSMNPVKV